MNLVTKETTNIEKREKKALEAISKEREFQRETIERLKEGEMVLYSYDFWG